MPKIFISYRREDSPYESVSVRDRLASHFGEGNVFFDLDSIRFGHNFRLKIGEKVGQCDYLIAVIGKSWLTVCDKQGQRRLDNPDDWVRLEIQAALSRNIPVIAVLLHNVRMPERDELPAGLEELADRQAIPIRPLADFRHDIDRLIRDIDHQEKERLDAAAEATAKAEQEAQAERRETESRPIEEEKRERESTALAEEERRQAEAPRVPKAAEGTQAQSDRKKAPAEPTGSPKAVLPPLFKFVRPTSRSYFMAGKTETIRWTTFREIEASVERFELELLWQGRPIAVICGPDAALSGTCRRYSWDIPADLPTGRGYQIKLSAWDNLGHVDVSLSDPFTLPVTWRTLQYARLGGAGLGVLIFLIDRLSHEVDYSFLLALLDTHDTGIATVGGLLTLPPLFAWAVGLMVCYPPGRILIPALALIGAVVGRFPGFKEIVTYAFACYGVLLGSLICETARSHSRWAAQIRRLWMRLRKTPP